MSSNTSTVNTAISSVGVKVFFRDEIRRFQLSPISFKLLKTILKSMFEIRRFCKSALIVLKSNDGVQSLITSDEDLEKAVLVSEGIIRIVVHYDPTSGRNHARGHGSFARMEPFTRRGFCQLQQEGPCARSNQDSERTCRKNLRLAQKGFSMHPGHRVHCNKDAFLKPRRTCGRNVPHSPWPAWGERAGMGCHLGRQRGLYAQSFRAAHGKHEGQAPHFAKCGNPYKMNSRHPHWGGRNHFSRCATEMSAPQQFPNPWLRKDCGKSERRQRPWCRKHCGEEEQEVSVQFEGLNLKK